MKKLEFAAIATLAFCSVYAMPTKQEISEMRPLVAELMAPVMAEYKANAKTAVEVADTSVAFADSAKNEATRFLFLRGAVNYYAKGGEFGKAADTIEILKSKIRDIPPAEIASIISGALGRENARKAPRLQSQLLLAQAQVKSARDLSRLSVQLKKINTAPVRRQYAEALALSSDWKAALAEFAKVDGEVGKMTKGEADGSAGSAELGDFWWSYETSYAGAEGFFRDHAAGYYRKAIAEGKVDGLKKTLVEQRLASLVVPDVNESVAPAPAGRRDTTPPQRGRAAVPRSSSSKKDPSGLVARWSFTDGLKDSIGGIAPAKSENAEVANGAVSLRSGSPLEFAAGTVPLAPLAIQVWASATEKGLGADGDMIFNLASAQGNNDESVYWEWTNGGKKWVSRIGGFGESNKVGHGKMLVDGQMHLYTVTCEKNGKGMLLKFYQDDTCFGGLTTKFAWKKPPMLILGGFVTSTYDEVRVYARAFTHADVIASLNLGPEKLPEVGKGK